MHRGHGRCIEVTGDASMVAGLLRVVVRTGVTELLVQHVYLSHALVRQLHLCDVCEAHARGSRAHGTNTFRCIHPPS